MLMLSSLRNAIGRWPRYRRLNRIIDYDTNSTWKSIDIGKMYYCKGYNKREYDATSKEKLLVNLSDIKGDNNDRTGSDEFDRYDNNSWRTVRNSLVVLGVSFTLVGSWFVYKCGATRYDAYGAEIVDEYTNETPLVKYLSRAYKELKEYQKMISEPSRDKLLPDTVPDPYFQPPYTLVMEFTDVIVHPDWTYSTGWRFKKRPGLDQFLTSLQGLYEIVVYTAEMGLTVFPIINAIDTNNMISYKLVRDATHFVNGRHLKDLDRLNRDLRKVVVVDWKELSTTGHADNVLVLPRWTGNDDDTSLIDLANFLRVIAYSEVDDVREVLRNYSQYDDPLSMFRAKQRQLAEMNEKRERK